MTESFTYVARCSCGGVVKMVVDDPNDKKWTSHHVGDAIKAGYPVERMTTEQARQQTFCKNRGKCGKETAEQGGLFP